MKRMLPFLIILAVAAVTAVAGVWLYRVKMQSSAPVPVAATVQASAAPKPAAAATAAATESAASPYARGPADAPVTLEIYGDFQCPACATTSAEIDDLQKKNGKRLRVVFHEFPLAMHAHALEAAMAAEAAAEQGRFWEMHDLLYKSQGVWSKASNPARFFNVYARSLGLDVERFAADSKSLEIKTRIMTGGDAGVARGVRNTPAIFVNGSEVRGAFNRATLEAAIEAAAAGKGQG